MIAGCLEGWRNLGGESMNGTSLSYESVSIGPDEPGDREYVILGDFYYGGYSLQELERQPDESAIHLVASESEREELHTDEVGSDLAALIEGTDFDEAFLLLFEALASSSATYGLDTVERTDEGAVHTSILNRHPHRTTADLVPHGIVARVYSDRRPERATYSIAREEIEAGEARVESEEEG